jgi:hypothetical protein
MDHQHGDGLARASVESLIRELDTGMRDIQRGGRTYLGKVDSPIGITGTNLAIVKTLLIHMNKLQDRIETLEGQIQDIQPDAKRNPECEEATAPVKKAKATPVAADEEPDHKDDLARYEQLKAELQKLYGGRAHEYDPTAGGHMFPPHGMCAADITLKMIDASQNGITKVETEIARLEKELDKHPYTPISPHSMIVLQPGSPNINNDRSQAARSIEKRPNIFRELAKQAAEHRILQEDINFWSQVKLASVDYMQQVQRMFVEKTELRARLLQTHGVRTVAW